MNIQEKLLCLLLLSSSMAISSEMQYIFSGTIGRVDDPIIQQQSFGEYPLNTPFCGSLTFNSNQKNMGTFYQGRYSYEKLTLVFPDDSDADNQPNVLVDYGKTGIDPFEARLEIWNHPFSDPNNTILYTVDEIQAVSFGPANGLVINQEGSATIAGFSAGDPNDWDWSWPTNETGIMVYLFAQFLENVFSYEDGVQLPSINTISESFDELADDPVLILMHDEETSFNRISTFKLGPIFSSGFDHENSSLEYLLQHCNLSVISDDIN